MVDMLSSPPRSGSIALTQCYDGRRLMAYRRGAPPGLYAVITDDPAELRNELDAKTVSRAS
ncbi:MAG: hypothetical protein JOY82_09770 [Streptosporangiaceae bacterium]|nr:hypothetical protein [Streptosporangiaceae bacterium]MBV9854798.1 hypothetical protein [Streptosporangiaceae bacterium]